MKYIIFEHNGLDIPIIFPHFIQHIDIKNKFNWEVISAGFVSVGENGGLTVYGKSISLKVGSRPEDTILLNELKNQS